MDVQLEIRLIMNREFERAKNSNASYSLRAFAKKLDMYPSAVSEILNGKRSVTEKMATKILENLSVAPDKYDRIIGGIKVKGPGRPKQTSEKEYLEIQMDQYHVISDWFYFAVLSLAETKGFISEPKWIADRLCISTRDATTAIERLERLGLLEVTSRGKIRPTGNQFRTSNDISSRSLRKSHLQTLDLAKKSLEIDDVKVRDVTSVTMAIDPALLPEAKKMIQKFRRQLCEFLESGRKKEVYRASINLFPLSKNEGEEQ